MTRCHGKTGKGKRCRLGATVGQFCRIHNPTGVEEFKRSRAVSANAKNAEVQRRERELARIDAFQKDAERREEMALTALGRCHMARSWAEVYECVGVVSRYRQEIKRFERARKRVCRPGWKLGTPTRGLAPARVGAR